MSDQPQKRRVGRPSRHERPVPPEDRTNDLAVAVAKGDPRIIEAALASRGMAPTFGRQRLTAEDLELVLVKVAGGQTVREACLDLGLEVVLVRKRAYDDLDFGDRLRQAHALAADHQFEEMMAVARDFTIPVADRRLIVEVIEKIAKTHNRPKYGDKVQVDHKQVMINVMPDDLRLA